jgi:predicted nucleotidyltransferase
VSSMLETFISIPQYIELMFNKLNMFSRTEANLLAFISGKDGELYEREIAKGAGISVGSTNAMLKRFATDGLVNMKKKGRMVFYSRNDSNPVLRQFKIFLTISGLKPLLDGFAPLSRRIILFGSCAEGRNGEKSDIDLFIISKEKDAIRRLLDIYPMIQAIILDQEEYIALQQKDKPLYERIQRGIELYGEEDG